MSAEGGFKLANFPDSIYDFNLMLSSQRFGGCCCYIFSFHDHSSAVSPNCMVSEQTERLHKWGLFSVYRRVLSGEAYSSMARS